MNAAARIQLRDIVATYGTEICTDARRVGALLRDLCAEHRLEISLIVAAAAEQVPAELLASKDGGFPLIAGRRLARELRDHVGLSDENAQWAVDSWAFALDITELLPVASTDRDDTDRDDTDLAGQELVPQVPEPAVPESPVSISLSQHQAPAPVAEIQRDEVPVNGLEEPAGEQAVRRRVQLGAPTRLPITQHELDTVKYLTNAVSSNDRSIFCLLRITPTFHEEKGGVITEAYVRVRLETPGKRLQNPPKVWAMQPGSVEETTSRSRSIQGSGGAKPARASVSLDSSYEKHESSIMAYGLQCPVAYWKFTRTRGRDIRGSHELAMVVWLPEGCQAEALIEIYATVRKRKFALIPVRGDVGNEQYSITLSQNDIQCEEISPEEVW